MLLLRRLFCRKYSIAVFCGMCVIAIVLHRSERISIYSTKRGSVHERTVSTFESRILKLKTECQRLKKIPTDQEKVNNTYLTPSAFVSNVFINRRYKLLYCSVAKIGTSFWKRVFKVLDVTNSKKLNLYDMKSTSAHLNIPESMTLTNITQGDFKNILATYMKLIFVRNPFSRLFSAYVDKILVPTSIQLDIINYFRHGNLTSTWKIPCNRKVSFREFSSLFAEDILQKKHFEHHFSTISSQCEPCNINFTMIGKMETFATDVREVFHRAHLEITEVTGSVHDNDTTYEVQTMKDVIERVWLYYFSRSIGCLRHLETAERLWKHLQIRGIISKTIPLPLSQGNDSVFSLENYTSAAVRAYEQSEPRQIRMRQREEAMMEAYSSVPQDTLEKLSRIFAVDCLLFDYSCDIGKFLSYKAPRFYFKNI